MAFSGDLSNKGRSPFYPGQPVPGELFVGRRQQIQRIMERGVGQVREGKPVAMFLQGEYGIGKSSIASFVQGHAEREGLHAIYAALGSAKNLDDVGAAILEGAIRSGAHEPTRADKIREWLAKYIGSQSLFGVNIRLEELRREAPSITSGLLPFLGEVIDKLANTGVRGVFLVLDEINGITSNDRFAHFLKGLVDTNALAKKPVPLLLMLCGVEERRREMIGHHSSIDRLFDVIDIEAMNRDEMREFFNRAFSSVAISVDSNALETLVEYSGGLPKIMHLIGEAAFWTDRDGRIDHEDALGAVLMAAEEVGKKYVDQQVYRELRSKDYRSILTKIGRAGLVTTFRRKEVAESLTEGERKKFDNLLRKMRRMNVIRSGESHGEYVFNVRMVQVYIWLSSLKKTEGSR